MPKQIQTIEVELPPMHRTQLPIIKDPARYKVVDAGRRWGKTRLGVVVDTVKAIQGYTVWWVAPSFPIALIGWRLVKALGVAVPGSHIREAERRIEFPTGGSLTVKSANDPDSLRGEGLDYVVLDEAAYINRAAWEHSLRPALADREGGALFISTPNGKNWFWQLYDRTVRGILGDEWKAWKHPTSDNPFVKPEEIARAKADMTEVVFQQEFLAEFLEDAGLVFRGIDDIAVAKPQKEPEEDHEYVLGVDWAKYNDWTVISVLDLTESALVHLDRFNQISSNLQMNRLIAACNKWNPRIVNIERNQAEKVTEDLKRAGVPVNPMYMQVQLKNKVIDDLAYAIENKEVYIIPDEQLLSELKAYQPKRLPSGHFRYSAPTGQHDDCVMSLALAWQARVQKRGIYMMLL